jgi:hypothetical protein
MQDVEDECCELDHQIARNRSVLRLLSIGGDPAIYKTAIVKDEFKAIYGKMGAMLASLAVEFSAVLAPVFIATLTARYKDLLRQKFHKAPEWARKFERSLPSGRTMYQHAGPEVLRDMPIIQHAGGEVIHFKVWHTILLTQFAEKAVNAQVMEAYEAKGVRDCAKVVILNLRASDTKFKVSFAMALAMVSGALLLSLLAECPVIDGLETAGVQKAIALGLSSADNHGIKRLVNILAAMSGKSRSKGVRQIAALCFDMNYERAAVLEKVAQAFLKALKLCANESGGCAFVICAVANGTICLKGYGGEPAEINLSLL